MRMRWFGVSSAVVIGGLAAPAMAQGFAPGAHFYQAPAGEIWNRATLADDGRTVAGETLRTSPSTIRGFTLQGDGVTHEFAEVSRVYDVSDNGAYTVGYSTRRAADGTTIPLVPYTQPAASAVGAKISGDGQTVAGTAEVVLGGTISAASTWRWTATGGAVAMAPYRPNAAVTYVTDISGDGSTIVGWGSPFFGGGASAWSWTQASGYSILPDLPDALFQSAYANGASHDGSVVVGYGNNAQGRSRAIIWRNGVPTAMPPTSEYRFSQATGVNGDGSLVVGTEYGSLTGSPDTAAIWTQSTNWVPALDYLRGQGLDIPSYYRSTNIQVSSDGMTFASIVADTRNSTTTLMIAVVPPPVSLTPLGMFWLTRRRARARQ